MFDGGAGRATPKGDPRPSGAAPVEKRLPLWQRLADRAVVRQALLLVAIAIVWELYGRHIDNDLVFPTFSAVARAFADGMLSGVLPERAWGSLKLLLTGYAVGIVAAFVLTLAAVTTRIGTDLLTLLTTMFNPLPAVALLPLALLWFGLGAGSMVFVLVHAVLWPLALNTHAGFLGVAETLRMAGRSFGLSGLRFTLLILIPAAFPAILTGLKIGWAFAWRTLIAAELVFGVSSRSGGLGWYVFENRNLLQIPEVFAGLLAVILIGLLVEGVFFRTVERLTVRRWGMQR